VCAGYQMMGRTITDDVESGRGRIDGLGWLDVRTVFEPVKVVRRHRTTALGHDVPGYEIHHGRVDGGEWTDDGRHIGTTLHGVFEDDGFRVAFLEELARRRDKTFVSAGVSFAAA